jgi:hypothetical protein
MIIQEHIICCHASGEIGGREKKKDDDGKREKKKKRIRSKEKTVNIEVFLRAFMKRYFNNLEYQRMK